MAYPKATWTSREAYAFVSVRSKQGCWVCGSACIRHRRYQALSRPQVFVFIVHGSDNKTSRQSGSLLQLSDSAIAAGSRGQWKHYLLPPPPLYFLRSKALSFNVLGPLLFLHHPNIGASHPSSYLIFYPIIPCLTRTFVLKDQNRIFSFQNMSI